MGKPSKSEKAKVPTKVNRKRQVLNDSKKHKCYFCPLVLKTFSEFKNHLDDKHSNSCFLCTRCPKVFDRPSSVTIHCTTQHGQFKCNHQDCSNIIQKQQLTPEQIASLEPKTIVKGSGAETKEHSNGLFNCFDCRASFNSIGELFEHCRVHRYDSFGKPFRYLIPTVVKK